MIKHYLILLLLFPFGGIVTAQEASSVAYMGESGCMEYVADEANNYIPDFSYAGYQGGGIPLPEVPTVLTLSPINGDNTAHIQSGIDSIAKLPLADNGLRGALQLGAGVYEIHGQIFIHESGIVLRGVGAELDSTVNTILKGIGNVPNQRDLIIAGNNTIGDWKKRIPNSTVNITNAFVPGGSRSLSVAAIEKFTIGDEIVVYQPSTDAWLASINYGDTATDEPWKPGEIDLYYQRKIIDILPQTKQILLSAPIYDHLDNSLAQSSIYLLNEPDIKSNIGIENLHILIETAGAETENHVKSAILLKGIRDSWVQNVTAQHFMYAAVHTRTATNVTVRNCQGLQPHSLITGARRYNFSTDAYSNNILFEQCHTSYGRHAYVSNGTSSASGIVVYNCTTEHDYSISEGHRRWSQGMLFDNITFTNPETTNLLGFYNRGDYGTGHGWAAVNSVAWNININSAVRKILIQKPPGRQNYAIGCFGLVTNVDRFTHPIGINELTRKKVTPSSLYETQLAERLANGSRPDAPAKLTVIFDENTQQYQLNWLDIAADEMGYKIQISTDEGKIFSAIAQVNNNVEQYTYSPSDTIYGSLIFRVVAFNDVCLSAFSNPVTIEMLVANEEIDIPDCSIFPNPANQTLFIKGKIAIKTATIYTAQGRNVGHYSENLDSIDISDLNQGIFYLKIVNKGGQKGIYKFIKNN